MNTRRPRPGAMKANSVVSLTLSANSASRLLAHDSAIGRDDVDDSFAKVASVRAGNLDLQDDVACRRRLPQRAGELSVTVVGCVARLLVRALDVVAHAIVRL